MNNHNESKFAGLSDEQRAQLDKWLREEKKPYDEIVDLCQTEFNLQVSKSGICRYYKSHCCPENCEETPVNYGASAWRLGIATDDLYRELVEGTVRLAVNEMQITRKKIGINRMIQLMRLQISARREANEAQRVAMAREKLEFDAATACLLHQLEIAKVAGNDAIPEADRIRAIRQKLFGPLLPE